MVDLARAMQGSRFQVFCAVKPAACAAGDLLRPQGLGDARCGRRRRRRFVGSIPASAYVMQRSIGTFDFADDVRSAW